MSEIPSETQGDKYLAENTPADLRSRLQTWALRRAMTFNTELGLQITGESVRKPAADLPINPTFQATPQQIDRTKAGTTASEPQTTPKTKQDYMPYLSPQSRTLNPERFV